MIEFVDKASFLDEPLLIITTDDVEAGEPALSDWNAITDDLWDFHLNFRRYWENGKHEVMPPIEIRVKERILDYRRYTYELHIIPEYFEPNQTLSGGIDFFDNNDNPVGWINLTGESPDPTTGDHSTEYKFPPFEFDPDGPRMFRAHYDFTIVTHPEDEEEGDHSGDTFNHFEGDISDIAIHRFEDATTEEELLDEEITNFYKICPNVRGFVDARVVPQGTEPIPEGKIKSPKAQAWSGMFTLGMAGMPHIYICPGRADYIAGVVMPADHDWRKLDEGGLQLFPFGTYFFFNAFHFTREGFSGEYFSGGSFPNDPPEGEDWEVIENEDPAGESVVMEIGPFQVIERYYDTTKERKVLDFVIGGV